MPSPSTATRLYGLPVTEALGVPHDDANGVTEEQIRAVVVEFYQRARLDDRLGPVFAQHIHDWDHHLARMTDFWSSALLRTGRYSGNPIQQHRAIDNLSLEHFDRWLALFETTVNDVCPDGQARAFVDRARKMREAMSKVFGLSD